MRFFIAIFFFISCGKKQEYVVQNKIDSIIEKSKFTTKTVSVLIPKIDRIIHNKQQEVINKIKELETKALYIDSSKVIYVHDTVYLKTNFWGKTKVIEKDN